MELVTRLSKQMKAFQHSKRCASMASAYKRLASKHKQTGQAMNKPADILKALTLRSTLCFLLLSLVSSPLMAAPPPSQSCGWKMECIRLDLSWIPGKRIAFIDTCHSGNILGTRRSVADTNAVINDLTASENGVVVFSSSSGKQFSLEDAKWQNGAFTKALVEGLNGKAYQIFPNTKEHNNKITAKVELNIPNATWRMPANGPPGIDTFSNNI